MKVIYLNKPYGVLCQFTDTSERVTLANYFHNDEASGCYAAGRLDKDSEGLVVLTDNGTYQHLVSHPDFKAPKVYWAQVEGDIGEREVNLLRKGVTLNDGMTRPAGARVISEPDVWAREPPIRMRKHIPTRWLELTLYEGRNRQVRRMTAAVGFPTLRLIRFAVGDVNLDNVVHGMRLPPGQSAMHHLSEKEFAKLRRYRSSKSDTFKDARRRKHHPMKPNSR